MTRRARKSSSQVRLVLIGLASLSALSGCERVDTRRDVYASKQDCLADWGNTPEDCQPAYDRPTGNAATTYYYGRPYAYRSGSGVDRPRSSRAIGSSEVTRGGFGSSGRSSSS